MKTLTRLCAAMAFVAAFPAAAQIGATTPPVTRAPLIDALNALAAKDEAARREAVAAIRTPAEFASRQAHVRKTILGLLGGLPTDHPPLAARVTHTIHQDGFDVKTVIYDAERRLARTGDGLGLNVNLPMPHRSPESVFFDKLGDAIAALERFQPDALVLSLGFDIYREDPQSQVDVSTQGFGRLGQAVGAIGLPTLVVQEGGYHLPTLAQNAAAFFGGLTSLHRPAG